MKNDEIKSEKRCETVLDAANEFADKICGGLTELKIDGVGIVRSLLTSAFMAGIKHRLIHQQKIDEMFSEIFGKPAPEISADESMGLMGAQLRDYLLEIRELERRIDSLEKKSEADHAA